MSNSWFSIPRSYTIQVGPFSSSQVSVSGTLAVCNGNSYTYTAEVPGGHRNGYTYNWTFPSGWTIESTSSNSIRLYVPTYNSSYGPIRVSVNNVCGSTPFTGITVYPCGYMMSSGDFQIYPNPSNGELNIEYKSTEESHMKFTATENVILEAEQTEKIFKVEIFDRLEKLVKSSVSKEGKVRFETIGLAPGTYFVHIHLGKEVIREQILIQ